MKWLSVFKNPYLSLAFNFAYALGNCALGFIFGSWWFITAGAYYAVLTVTRYSVLRLEKRSDGNQSDALFARRFTGILLAVLSFCIVGVNVLSAVEKRGTEFHKILKNM